MSDRRDTPNPRWVDANSPAQIGVAVTDLLDAPGGARDRQLILGDAVTVLGAREGHSYVRADHDGYVGFVATETLVTATTPTHVVSAFASHAYARADIKSPDLMALSFGSRLTALSETPIFVETALGFIPTQHVTSIGHENDDPAAIAMLYLGTPYLWGGNSASGIDCSGLIQSALRACNIACPGDSDQQARTLGTVLPEGTPPQRNDLMFWPGHVALVVDPETLIHANAYAMATTLEPITQTLTRIAQTDGARTAHKRLLLA